MEVATPIEKPGKPKRGKEANTELLKEFESFGKVTKEFCA
jgi:hypothetical protein